MSWNSTEPFENKQLDNTAQCGYFDLLKKPIEIYLFVDPLCADCWSLEPLIKKLGIEYGRFFTIRPILSGKLKTLNQDILERPQRLKEHWEKTASRSGMCCDGDLWVENPISYPYIVSVAIKAAELQGKKAGKKFLRKLQEHAFLDKRDISKENNLITCAKEAQLDLIEFKNDLHSNSAKKALQCDLKLTKEMEVENVPSLVFFNEADDEEGLKLSGVYPYDIYVNVLQEMLQRQVKPAKKPSLEDFVAYFQFIGTKEVAVVYDWSIEQAEKEMKKLQLKQMVEKVPVKKGVFWKYIM
ncbi:UPF0413 protein YjbH [Paraliobacillus quinghaiensis]|uniref:ClpXP adapter protein SpxH n=1 Tax=Paraliobacillus quinghaiensis TaxID=470815 RepID=A0A917WS62_9BACI|nr:ClpXP adapter SpxH family protein [Paraliobacillus quinghaiensis]GGM24786.1 UPF0413 protein YjbH [Paraliobacillus quinghaiensis]